MRVQLDVAMNATVFSQKILKQDFFLQPDALLPKQQHQCTEGILVNFKNTFINLCSKINESTLQIA